MEAFTVGQKSRSYPYHFTIKLVSANDSSPQKITWSKHQPISILSSLVPCMSACNPYYLGSKVKH